MTADKLILMLIVVCIATLAVSLVNSGAANIAGQMFTADGVSAKWVTNQYFKGD